MKHIITYKPSITEKSLSESKNNRYTFIVPVSTRKHEFVEELEKKIKSKVISVNSKITDSVKRRRGKSSMTKVKYMTVKLPKDKKIDGFEAPK